MDTKRRDELVNSMTTAIQKLRTNREENEEYRICEYMILQLKDKISMGKIKQAITQPSSLTTLDTSELYLVASRFKNYCELNSASELFNINLEQYFDPEEREWANYKLLSDDDNKELKIKAMQKGTAIKPEWIGIMTYEEIVSASKRGLLKYNMSTQRIANVFIKDGITNFIPDISEETVDKIAQSILKGSFEPNTITLNILRDVDDEPYFNESEKDNVLSINTDENEVDIIDGMHRIKGIVKAWMIREKEIEYKEHDTQISGTMAVCVKNITEEQAKTFIHQESLANRQSKSANFLYSSDSFVPRFFTRLNDAEGSVNRNPYYNKISSYMDESVVISTSFAIKFLDDMGAAKKLDKEISSETILRKTVSNLVGFAGIVFDALRERDDYKKNRLIFEGQCFLVGLMSYFVYNMKSKNAAFDLEDKKVDEFISRISSIDVSSLVYDYPLTNRQKNELKALYR